MTKLWAFIGMIIALNAVVLPCPAHAEATNYITLTRAVLVTPADMTVPEQKAVTMLLDEVEKRSQVRWTETHAWPSANETAVAVGSLASAKAFAGPYADSLPTETRAAEGFTIRAVQGRAVLVAGNDARGVLFGVGRLLRELRMSRDSIHVSSTLDITTAPKYPLRGHQLGYRPKVNTYDGWTVPMFEQYIRDLAVFGTNAIELIPPRSDDAPDSPHFVMPQIEMMKRVSQICDDYGLDVWIWYPAMTANYKKPETVDACLKEWDDVLSQLPRVDAIFLPSGDPGRLEPEHLLEFFEKATEVLHKSHPKAQSWVSTQSFNLEKLQWLLDSLNKQQPAWLTGIVFGPQNRIPLKDLRQAIPPQYPIRHYPDITHSVQCQFPVPEWDPAYAWTEQREVINPRPNDYANIIRAYDEFTNGFITYSEGCNDDVNKIVWSALGWDPDMPVFEVLRQYSRYFIGPDLEGAFAQGILALEQNWRGPLLTNQGVFTTLAQFKDMERTASPQQLLNWRFQQGLYRAYYDAYTARRLAYETEIGQQAMDVLREAPRLTAATAMDKAERVLDRCVLAPVAQDLRARVFELAEALYQSIRMQLSVPRYKAIRVDRGANLDLIDVPLNDRLWLKAQFAEIRQATDESERLSRLAGIVHWTNPGPGGFYDNLGNLAQQPHLVREPSPTADPEFWQAPLIGNEYDPLNKMSWNAYAETRFDSPLRLQYNDLDPDAAYKVRVIYSGDDFDIKMRLAADDQYEIHPLISKPQPIKPVEFHIPVEATRDGRLTLSFTQEPNRRGGGRGCQVSEVWLIRTAE